MSLSSYRLQNSNHSVNPWPGGLDQNLPIGSDTTTRKFRWLAKHNTRWLVFDTGLSVTPLMGHIGCLASHWSVPVVTTWGFHPISLLYQMNLTSLLTCHFWCKISLEKTLKNSKKSQVTSPQPLFTWWFVKTPPYLWFRCKGTAGQKHFLNVKNGWAYWYR